MKKTTLIIEKLFKQMIENMPVEEYMKMTLYKLAKSDEISDDRVLALMCVLRCSDLCLDVFYDSKIKELSEEHSDRALIILKSAYNFGEEGFENASIDTLDS